MLLHKSVIAALTVAVNKNDSRYALGGIHIDADGVAVATDGHMLLYARKPASIPAEEYPSNPTPTTTPLEPGATIGGQTVPIDALTTAAKHIRGKQYISAYDHVAICPSNTSLRVVAINGPSAVSDQHVDPLEGPFPKWDRVLPTHTTTLTVRLSARILADLAKAAKAIGGKGDCAVTFEFTNEGNRDPGMGYADGIRVTLDSVAGHDVGGVVMPLRK